MTTLAPILINITLRVRSDHCFILFGKAKRLRKLPRPFRQEVRIVVAGLSALGIMAGYEEIANISAGIGRDIAKRDPGPKETV